MKFNIVNNDNLIKNRKSAFVESKTCMLIYIFDFLTIRILDDLEIALKIHVIG